MNFADQLIQLTAAEWKRVREGHMTAARICSEPLMCRALIWTARRANHEFIKLVRA